MFANTLMNISLDIFETTSANTLRITSEDLIAETSVNTPVISYMDASTVFDSEDPDELVDRLCFLD